MSDEIKTHLRAVSFSFIWGLTVDHTTRYSLSDSSEEVREEVSIYVILEKRYLQSDTHLGRRLLLVRRNRYLS